MKKTHILAGLFAVVCSLSFSTMTVDQSAPNHPQRAERPERVGR